MWPRLIPKTPNSEWGGREEGKEGGRGKGGGKGEGGGRWLEKEGGVKGNIIYMYTVYVYKVGGRSVEA